jgi:hypothetical protein
MQKVSDELLCGLVYCVCFYVADLKEDGNMYREGRWMVNDDGDDKFRN